MSKAIGIMLTCDRCGLYEFLPLKNGCVADPHDLSSAIHEKYEMRPGSWWPHTSLGVLCRECHEEWMLFEREQNARKKAFISEGASKRHTGIAEARGGNT